MFMKQNNKVVLFNEWGFHFNLLIKHCSYHIYDLLKSYLTQRQQVVEYNGCISDKLLIKAGVPQGFVLGLFFVFYLYK